MNCKNHFLERWVERIVGVEPGDCKRYITHNRDNLVSHCTKTFEYATFLYKGAIGDNITRNYYIKDDIIFVTDSSGDVLITVYKVDLGFPEEINSQVRAGLIKEINKLQEEKEKIERTTEEDISRLKYEAEAAEDEIDLLYKQIEMLKERKKFKEEEVKQLKSTTLDIGLKIKRYTLNLVNSMEYKKDLQTLK